MVNSFIVKRSPLVIKTFLSILVPTILMNLTTAIGSMADAVIIGQYLDELSLSVVTYATPIYMIINTIAALFAIGGCIAVSVDTGKGDKTGANKAFSISAICLVFLSMLLFLAGVFFSDLLITLIRRLLLPLLYFHIAVSAADAMVAGERLKGLAVGIEKVISWMLTGSVLLYTGYLTLSGAMAESADTVAMHVTQSVMGVVPVVGNIISNAAGTVLSGAAMLKNTIGVVGMLAVLAICLVPILELAAQYLMYKLTAFLAGTFGAPQLVKLIEALGGAFGMILGMTAACALMLLISIITSVSVVTI
jgi:stage III sporulation protein AE